MGVAENKKTIQTYLEAMRTGTLHTTRALLADDMVARIPVSGENILGNQRIVRGADEILKTRAAIRGGYFAQEMKFNFKALLGDGDFVAAFIEMITVTANGDDYANDYVFLFKFRDGKIAEWDAFMDTAHVYQQFGYKITKD